MEMVGAFFILLRNIALIGAVTFFPLCVFLFFSLHGDLLVMIQVRPGREVKKLLDELNVESI
ncbi:hypothetical protein DL95DRAFT_384509, partial [Leptodontidium sp. 2 PMI_412]